MKDVRLKDHFRYSVKNGLKGNGGHKVHRGSYKNLKEKL